MTKISTRTKLEVWKNTLGEWRWRLVARGGEVVAISPEGYGSMASARNAANRLKAHIALAWLEVVDEG